MNKKIAFQDLGEIPFKQAWDYQTDLLQATVNQKIANRSLEEKVPTNNYLLFCSHPHVYTLGKSGLMEHVLLSEKEMEERGIEFYKINRGGDITYHGPGQIVGYPILDMENFFTDIHRYLRFLEECIILTLSDYGVEAGRLEGATGVWIEPGNLEKARKICAMGIRCSRWVTMHGWAFNVNTDLDYFGHIVPCGIDDKAVTSLQNELGVEKVDEEEVKGKLLQHFEDLFEAEIYLKKEARRNDK